VKFFHYHSLKFQHFYALLQVKEDEMGGVCSTHGRDKKCMQDFGQKTRREETNQKT